MRIRLETVVGMTVLRKTAKLLVVVVPIAVVLSIVMALSESFTLGSSIGFVMLIIVWPSLVLLMLVLVARWNADVTTPVTWGQRRRPVDTGVLQRVVRESESSREHIIKGDSTTTFRSACTKSMMLSERPTESSWVVLDESGADISEAFLQDYDGIVTVRFM